MKLIIHGNKIVVTKSIKEYVMGKIKKLDVYFEKPEEISATVNIRVKNLDQTIEVTIPTKKFVIRAEESNPDLYAAIDLVVDKLERQITKNKSKINKRYRNVPEFEMVFDIKDNEDEESLKIKKRKTLDSKPMDEEEALIQMQLLNHDFFIFKNVDENCVSVLYKRKDDSFGIINVK